MTKPYEYLAIFYILRSIFFHGFSDLPRASALFVTTDQNFAMSSEQQRPHRNSLILSGQKISVGIVPARADLPRLGHRFVCAASSPYERGRFF